MVAIASVPLLFAFVRFATTTALLDGDASVFALNVADAASGSFPTTGFYSRYGWSHPGPIAAYLMVPFHWLAQGRPWGMMLGAAAWHVAALVVAAWMAGRRAATETGQFVLVVGAVGAHTLAWFTNSTFSLVDPWNPTLAAVIVVPLLLALWGTAVGDSVSTAVAAVLAVVAVQLHVAYGVIAAGPIVVAVALGFRHRRSWRRRELALGATAVVAISSPMIIDLLVGSTGNLASIIRFFGRDAVHAGFGRALRMVAAEFAPVPIWLGGSRANAGFAGATEASVWWLVVPIVGLAASVWVARRRGDTAALAFVAVVAAALVVQVVAIARIEGFVYEYLVRFRTPTATVTVLCVMRSIGPALARPSARVTAIVGVAAVSIAAVAGVAQVAGRAELHAAASSIEPLVDDATDAARRDDQTILVRQADAGFRGVLSTTLWSLVHHGADARVDQELAYIYGDRTVAADEADAVWYVTDGGAALSLLSALDGAVIVASETPHSAVDEARVAELQRLVYAELVLAGRDDLWIALDSPLVALATEEVGSVTPDVARELAVLNEARGEAVRAGVVAFSPIDAPDFFLAAPDGS